MMVSEPFLPYSKVRALFELRTFAGVASAWKPALPLGELPEELNHVWRTMSEFCSVVNFAFMSNQLFSLQTFLDTMTSVMYRLLAMDYEPDSKNNATRLGLLVFSCSIFLQWHHLGLTYHSVTSEYRSGLMKLESLQIEPCLALWLLTVGTVVVFNKNDDWWLTPLLLKNLDLCDVHSWNEMKSLLESVMWVPALHDKKGKYLFSSATAR
jgi:hypothetical protein